MRYYRFAVLGDPIEHSRSPELHHSLLQLAGLEGEYLRIRADEQVLEHEVDRLRSGQWDGLNVTMPLKAAAARMADSNSPLAERSGSVNTLMRLDSGIHGESTDAVAFQELIDSGRFAGRTSILILGTGGSAAAALSALGDEAPVYLAARNPERASGLSARLGGDVVAWGTAVAGALVINCTPLGMNGEALPPDVLEVASGLIDLPYAVAETPAVLTARHRRLALADGREFLIRQATASFRLWTGAAVAYETLLDIVRKG